MYIYIYIYTYIHMYIYTHIHIHTYIHKMCLLDVKLRIKYISKQTIDVANYKLL